MKKHIAIIAAAVMALSVLTACGTQTDTTETNTAVADTADTNSESTPGTPEDKGDHGRQNRTSAQVTAIDGSNVTLKLATEPDGEPQEKPENGDNKGEMPEMTFDGEEIAVEITDGMLKSMDMPEPNGEQPQPPTGEQPQGEKPDGEQPQGEKPDGEQPQGEKPDGEKPDGEQPQKPDGDNGNFEDNLEDLDISELAVNDVVNVIYDEDGTTIKYIVKGNK